MKTGFDAWWVDNHDSHGDCYETARNAWNEQQKKLDTCREREGRLREALQKTVRACRCRGAGRYDMGCTLCGDSTFDHECNDREVDCTYAACVAARTALAEGKGEGR